MRGELQDALRWWIARGTIFLGWVLSVRHAWRLKRFGATQRHLRIQYGIAPDTPIQGHGPALQAQLYRCVEGRSAAYRLAETSGSSGSPKQIPYTEARVRRVKAVYIDAFARAYAHLHICRTSLYVFTSLRSDSSLTALMMAESAELPPYLSTLQAPYRVHHHPELRALSERYGDAAVRVWVLALSNPGCLYATNPSTLSVFMDSLDGSWEEARAMVVDWMDNGAQFSGAVHRIARRLQSRGWSERLNAIAAAPAGQGLMDIVPGLEMICCWDGGYVRPFLDRVLGRLRGVHIRHLPMYSMSTETVETVPHFGEEGVSFVPLVSGALMEFLPVSGPQDVQALLEPHQLKAGDEVSLVVSDGYGLCRYDTEDVFRVVGHIRGLPDLRFLRRRGLRFSFTGEKLTGEHVRAAVDANGQAHPWLKTVPWVVIVPSQPDSEPVPHYRLVAGVHTWGMTIDGHAAAADVDAALGVQNAEYRDKRASGRLAPLRFVQLPLSDLVGAAGGERHANSWETQFKFLPLLTRTWEDVFVEEE